MLAPKKRQHIRESPKRTEILSEKGPRGYWVRITQIFSEVAKNPPRTRKAIGGFFILRDSVTGNIPGLEPGDSEVGSPPDVRRTRLVVWRGILVPQPYVL